MKREKLILLSIGILVFFCAIIGINAQKNNFLNPYLQSSVLHQSTIHKIESEREIMVYIPKVQSGEELVRSVTEEKLELVEEIFLMGTIRIEGYVLLESDQFISIAYEGQALVEEKEIKFQFGILVDKIEEKEVIVKEWLNEKAVGRLVNELRWQINKNENSLYTVSFLEKSIEGDLYFDFIYVDDEKLNIVSLIGDKKKWMEWNFPLSEIENYQQIQIIEGKNPTELSPYRYFIDSSKPIIALTFDDGPHAVYTSKIVEELNKYNATATFYIVGNRLSSEDHQRAMNKIIEKGNEVGDHSWSHKNLRRLKDEKFIDEIEGTTKRLQELEMNTEITGFRPPYGLFGIKEKENAKYPLVMWSVDPQDWKIKDEEALVEEIMAVVEDGDIVLLHDLHQETALAIEKLLPLLIEQGYQLVGVEAMMEAKGIEMEVGEVYYHAKRSED